MLMKQSMIAEFADILGTTVEYLICGVINIPDLDADSELFEAMNEKTRADHAGADEGGSKDVIGFR